MIEIKNVSKSFHTRALDVDAVKNVSISIDDGEVYGVIGYSGAGKSTLIRCINFLEIPDSGTIEIKGYGKVESKAGVLYLTEEGKQQEKLSDKKLRELRRNIGMIFQHFNLLDRSTVFENIAYPLQHTGRSKEEIKARVLELLKLVDLSEKVDSYPSQLSGGQKQRVAIARALACSPKILLCDEATSALDPEATESILKLLRELNKKLGLTIVIITHEMAVIKSICNEVTVMENGEAVEQGDVYNIFANPQRDITKKFVNSSKGFSGLSEIVEGTNNSNRNLVQLTFGKDAVGDALISDVSRKFNIDVNIVLANVEMIGDTPLGSMIVLLTGTPENVENAVAYFKSCNVKVEVIEVDRTI